MKITDDKTLITGKENIQTTKVRLPTKQSFQHVVGIHLLSAISVTKHSLKKGQLVLT